MRVREMREGDVPQAALLERCVFSRPWSEQALADSLKEKEYLFGVAEEAGKLCGYCGMQRILEEGEITNVAVFPEYQGQGIGNALMSWLVKKAAEAGVERIYLEVRRSNEKALRLYRKFDFVEVGVRKGFYEAPREDALLLCRSREKGFPAL